MKLLLDENLPHQLRHELPGHGCSTVAYMGWAGVENGDLLTRAAQAGFDALLTMDAGIPYEQNLVNLPLAVVAIRAASNDIRYPPTRADNSQRIELVAGEANRVYSVAHASRGMHTSSLRCNQT
jgi:hypothetical protein